MRLRSRDGLYAAAFKGDTDTLMAVWCLEGPIDITPARKPKRMLDLAGSEMAPTETVSVSGSPVYLFYDGEASIEETLTL